MPKASLAAIVKHCDQLLRTRASFPRINHFAAHALEWRGVARDDAMAA